MEKDLEKKVPLARWDDPDNEIHKMQWELTELAIKAVRDSKDPGKAREMLDRAIHSDQFWWASARPWWSLEMIERGAVELKEAVLATPDAAEERDWCGGPFPGRALWSAAPRGFGDRH